MNPDIVPKTAPAAAARPIARLLAAVMALALAACARTESAAPATSVSKPAAVTPRLLYDSNRDLFAAFRKHSNEVRPGMRYSLHPGREGQPAELEMASLEGGLIPANLTCRGLRRGRVEFEYTVPVSGAPDSHAMLVAIPIKDRRDGAVVEAGFSVQEDPGNAASPWRRRHLLPRAHHADGQWHRATLEFDFRTTPEAVHTIIGLRLNEGVPHPAPGRVRYRNLRVFALE